MAIPEAEAAGIGGKLAVYGLVAVIIAGIGFGAAWRVRQGTIDALNKNNATLSQSLKTATDQIGVQNTAIAGYQAAAKKSALNAQAALEAAQKAGATARKRASVILALKPVSGVDLCTQARELIDSELTQERAAQ